MRRIILRQNGFSLMELIVCLFIINFGMIGVLSLVLQNIKVENINKNMLIAAQLAQEGIELVRNKRDGNWLNGNVSEEAYWKKDVATYNGKSTYAIDYLGVCYDVDKIDDNNARLYINGDGYYTHKSDLIAHGNMPTIFYRLISIKEVEDDLIIVYSIVRWKEHGTSHDYVAESYLYDW